MGRFPIVHNILFLTKFLDCYFKMNLIAFTHNVKCPDDNNISDEMLFDYAEVSNLKKGNLTARDQYFVVFLHV